MKAIPCPISKEALHKWTHVDRLTDEEIAARIPDATSKRVRAWRHRYGIPTLPRWARNDILPIEGRMRSLLVGSMLGDGRIVRRVHASYYSERHCGAQLEYLKWKAGLWGPWAGPVQSIPDKRGFSQFGFFTCAHADLNEWQEMFYADKHKGWKRLVPEIVDMVDEFALAIWYLDDGHAGWWPGITFGADPASREVAWAIFDKFGLKPRWASRVGNTGAFHMEREETALHFLSLIGPHVPDCMKYKLGPFGFEGPQFKIRLKMEPSRLEEMSCAGVPLNQMATQLGVGASTVSRWLHKMGISHPRKVGRPTRLT